MSLTQFLRTLREVERPFPPERLLQAVRERAQLLLCDIWGLGFLLGDVSNDTSDPITINFCRQHFWRAWYIFIIASYLMPSNPKPSY